VPLKGETEPPAAISTDSDLIAATRQSTPTQLEVAIYIESMSAELRTMAKVVQLESLAYFLEMVRMEASSQIERAARRA
jgi:hypothetical protein